MLKAMLMSRISPRGARPRAALRLGTTALALVLTVLLLAGCGGGGSGSTSTSTSSSANDASAIKSFAKDTKSKKIVSFGDEGTTPELTAASAVLSENLKARAAADFRTQCDSLGVAGLEKILGSVKDRQKALAECPAALRKIAEPLVGTKGVRTDTLSGPIAAFRVKADKGYALYHGTNGEDFAVPMEKEDGEWRVGAIMTTPLD